MALSRTAFLVLPRAGVLQLVLDQVVAPECSASFKARYAPSGESKHGGNGLVSLFSQRGEKLASRLPACLSVYLSIMAGHFRMATITLLLFALV